MRKLILKSGFSPGDIVMLTAAVRDLHHWYPGQFLTDVRTLCPGLWENNPHLTPLAEDAPEVELIDCSYPLIDHCNEAPYHCLHGFIDFLNQRLGLTIRPTAFKGDIHLSDLERSWYSQVHEAIGQDTPFCIVAAGGKYDVTIKWWRTERYQKVVDYFRGKILFAQVGELGHHHPKLEGVIDLRGQTNLRELVRLVYHSEGVLCSVTALMHLAAAVEIKGGAPRNRPCVVVAGGREPAHWEAYPDHQFVHTNGALPCCAAGGCWKDRVLPLGDGDKRDRPDHLCVDVVDHLPRCMDMISPEEIIRRVELYYSGRVLKYLSARQRRRAERGIVATGKNPYDQQPLSLHNAQMACERYLQTIPEYPGDCRGRGIVICGGGVRYFTNAWVCINMLRRLGCRLPVELWHLGPRELDRKMKGLLAPLGVECVDAFRVRQKHPVRKLGGWELKPYAILHCPFEEVLLLDADLRRSRLHKVFGLGSKEGLAELLQSDVSISKLDLTKYIQFTGVDGLSLLTCGSAPLLSVGAMLFSQRIPELIAELRKKFDFVLIDTAPAQHFSDARQLSRLSDGVILIVRSGVTAREAAVSTAQRFAEDGTPILGTILNDWTPTAGAPQYSDYVHYYHATKGSVD